MLRGVPASLLVFAAVVACQAAEPPADSSAVGESSAPVDSFAAVPESSWVTVTGPTLVGFYPIRSNEQLERDTGLAMALDNLSYHIGTAMDSLDSIGVSVNYRGGDTVWLRAPSHRWRFARVPDSLDVGYIFADTAGRMAILYGVRGYMDLIEYAREFRATGTVRPRQ